MRDWTKTLLPASFRGVPFNVDRNEMSGGRRLVAHEIAGGEGDAPVEDLGFATRTFDVTAYTSGDTADLKSIPLVLACSTKGPGFLILPLDGGLMAHSQGFRRSHEKDRNGYIAFEVTFLPAPDQPGTILTIGSVSAAVASGIDLAAAALGRLF